ncbi:hypothetical protein PCCS19_04020 [Paenibacillus sp. CCS19]|uniref:DUF5694 domain-containing protein n=1 Tax=Paenibacillus sp. CCS19 TaxID=3158387 RepID=UPI00255EB213|nr:DUF5694 domain-containing protein [Paenibacillus cellulosilyticus]GMK37349.1 hypothetical protein PCCS19_04020 [Paenibacillus cellulosilyticus]
MVWFNEFKKPKLMILGTFHMGPSNDLFSHQLQDILTDKRQQEIVEVVERIKRYRPTKLALEVETRNSEIINGQYEQYLAGTCELRVNEIYQVGFRIASELMHRKVYCIDWMEQGASTKGSGDVYEWAKKHQPELFESIFGWLHHTYSNEGEVSYRTILDMYRECNEPFQVKQHHTMYVNMARIGDWDQYIGMEWLIWWYQRNLILFSNLARIVDSSDDRILLIVGSAHVQIVSQFIEESGLFERELAYDYLR